MIVKSWVDRAGGGATVRASVQGVGAEKTFAKPLFSILNSTAMGTHKTFAQSQLLVPRAHRTSAH